MENCVALSYPGDTTDEKMKSSIFTLLPAAQFGKPRNSSVVNYFPNIVDEAVQVFLCSWDERHYHIYNEERQEYHFLLRIDKIIMKKKWKECLLEGNGFPSLPIDYGYRDNVQFWFTRHSEPYAVPIPRDKGNTLDTIRYAVTRCDPEIKWLDEACEILVPVPAIFLTKVIRIMTEAAKQEGVTIITAQFVEKIRDKRFAEKAE